MKRAFSRLNLLRLEDRLTPAAIATPFDVTTGGAQWNLRNDIQSPTLNPGQPAFGVFDAGLTGPPARSDAFDGAFLFAVNSTYYQDADGTVDLTNTTVTGDPLTLSGLVSSVEYYFDTASATVRALYTFTNPTGADITTTVQIGSNLGSDTDTKIEMTSSGDAVLDPSDRWFITSDAPTNSDPVLTWVRQGSGTVTAPTTLQAPGLGLDTYQEQFSLTVPAGETRRIMMFGQMHQDVAAAQADAVDFNSNASLEASGLLDDLTDTERSQIINWQIAGPTATLATAPDVNDASSASNYSFTVVYADPDGVTLATLDDNDITVTGPNAFSQNAKFASAVSGPGATSVTATYNLTPPGGTWNQTDNGTYTITINPGQISDPHGNGNEADQLGTFDVNVGKPSVTINQAAGQADPTSNSPINFTVVFSEPVTGFDANDVALGSTAGPVTAQVTGSGTTYNVAVSGMTQSGIVTASVIAGGAQDASGDTNAASTSTDNTVSFVQGAGPTAVLGSAPNVNDASNNSTYTFTVIYTDPDGVDASTIDGSDITVTGPNGFSQNANVQSIASVFTSATATYTITAPGGTFNSADNGTYTITLNGNQVEDVPGNSNNAAQLGTFTVTTNRPSVTINQAAGQTDPTSLSPINFTVVFSEPVTGFDASDLNIASSAGPVTAQVTGSGTTYNVAISGMNQSGVVSASVKAGGAQDASSDTNTASTSTDNSVTFVQVTPPANVELYATGAGAGGGPHVIVYNSDGTQRFSFFAYDASFTGGVRVATGDVTGDGIDDIVTAAGAGGGPHVRVFNGATGLLHAEWFAYTASFTGGVYVAVGDVDGDNIGEVITGAGPGGGPHVRAFNVIGGTGVVFREFFAYDASFLGGVRVASGDVNADNFDDIITGAGPGGGPHVIAYSGQNNAILSSFFAFSPSFNGGVYVAAGNLTSDNRADIVVGAGDGNARVRIFDGASSGGNILEDFVAYNASFDNGVRVGITDVDGDAFKDIIVGPGQGNDPLVRIFRGSNGDVADEFFAYDPSFQGGVYVG